VDKITKSTKRITEQLESSRTKVTTFRITQEGVNAMEWLSKRYNITLKELFNNIIGDEFFLESIKDMVVDDAISTNDIIVKKTQRISKLTLDRFNQFTKKYNVARDTLINTALLVLREEQINQIEAKRDVHTKALKEINNHLKISEKTMKELQILVGRKDSIYNRFGTIMTMLKVLSADITLELKEGKLINLENE